MATKNLPSVALRTERIAVRYASAIESESHQDSSVPFALRVESCSRKLHPASGPRQLEALRLIAEAHPDGLGTGPMTRAMRMILRAVP